MQTRAQKRWSVAPDADLHTVFEESFDAVYRYAARLTGSDRALAEDLVQDVYVRLLRAVRAGELLEFGVGWLISVVRNSFVDHVRRDRLVLTEWAIDPAVIDESDRAGVATAAVASLGELDRLVLTLHHVDGWSVQDVADAIGKSVSATESALVRARHAARQIMQRQAAYD